MSQKSKMKKFVEVIEKLCREHKGKSWRWEFTPSNRMVVVDAKTGERLTEEVDSPTKTKQEIATIRKMDDFIKKNPDQWRQFLKSQRNKHKLGTDSERP